MSGTAVVVIDRLIGATLKWAKERQLPPTGEMATQNAREFLARVRGIAADDVEVLGLDPVPGGFRVQLTASGGERYTVEVDSESGIYRLTRDQL